MLEANALPKNSTLVLIALVIVVLILVFGKRIDPRWWESKVERQLNAT
jgi:hypothetical protein